jgi:hypothetical protein
MKSSFFYYFHVESLVWKNGNTFQEYKNPELWNFNEILESENAWVVKFEMVKYAKFGFNRLIFHKNSLEMD